MIGKRKEDVEVEEVKEGRVAAEDYCRLRLRVERGRCARRGVHTIRCLDVARRRVDEAAKHLFFSRFAPSRRRCFPSVLFNTSHLSISHYPLFTFTKSAMARRVIITSAPAFHYCPRHVSVLSSTLSTFRFRTRTIHFSLFTKSAMARRVIITSAPGFHYCPLHVSVLYPPFNSALSTI